MQAHITPINIMNTNYTKIHSRFLIILFDNISLANMGNAYRIDAMKYAVVVSYGKHSQQVRELKSL